MDAPTTHPRTGVIPLPDEEARDLLEQVLAVARAGAPDAVVAFDLDSTLLDNRPRQAQILREYGEAEGIPVLARSLPDHWAGWDVRVAMQNAGLAPADAETHAAPFKAFWRARFFTSEYCALDRAIAGAPRYLEAVAGSGVRVVYLTGRHEGMRAGTLSSFTACGFPAPEGARVELLMKPALEETDDEYKARTYQTLRARGPVLAAFDNEPTHINGYRHAFPDCVCVHLATDHSPREVAVAAGIPSIRSFAAFAR